MKSSKWCVNGSYQNSPSNRCYAFNDSRYCVATLSMRHWLIILIITPEGHPRSRPLNCRTAVRFMTEAFFCCRHRRANISQYSGARRIASYVSMDGKPSAIVLLFSKRFILMITNTCTGGYGFGYTIAAKETLKAEITFWRNLLQASTVLAVGFAIGKICHEKGRPWVISSPGISP